MNNDNNRNPRNRRYQNVTDEDRARGNARRAEKNREDERKKAERVQFNSQWPEIKANFEPEVWREAYQRLHADALAASINKLQQLEGLSPEDAERKVFDILIKATFIELNFSNKGEQTAQTLFENLESAIENKEDMPFKSADDLMVFLKSMIPTFKMDVRTKKWRNTGTQTRKFCQVLAQRLELGDVIDDDNFDETYDEFKTIMEVAEHARKFAEKEFIMDVSSYEYLAAIAPEFKYDEESGRLSLNSEVCLLALHLPILSTALHSNNPKWFDRSRVATSFATQYGMGYPNTGKSVGVEPTTSAVEMSVFRNKFFDNTNPDLNKQYLNITYYPYPNAKISQLEAIQVEPDRLDYSNNFVTGTGPVSLDADGEKKGVDFGNLNNYLTELKGNTAKRNDLNG